MAGRGVPDAQEPAKHQCIEANRSFLNLDGTSFLDVSFASGCDIDSDSRAVVAADFDRDGATDLLVGSVGGGPLRLFLNRYPSTNRGVRIVLVGTESNRPAIGARIVARRGQRQIVRDVFPANGCHGQGPVETILGVGDAQVIDELTVRWPSGTTQRFVNVPGTGAVTLVEGESSPNHAQGNQL